MFDDVEDRYHIGVVHQARGQDFAMKQALGQAGLGQRAQDDLESDPLARPFIASGPDRSHSALPKQVLDSVSSVHQLACLQDGIGGGFALGFGSHHGSVSILRSANWMPSQR